MDYATTILTVLTTLLAGCNILQFIFFKATKKKYEAEAIQADTAAQHERVDLQQDQYDYVNGQLSRIQAEYYDLAEKYRSSMTDHLKEIDTKCNEIAELKSKLVYFKGLRCYVSDCPKRIKESPYKDKRKNESID